MLENIAGRWPERTYTGIILSLDTDLMKTRFIESDAKEKIEVLIDIDGHKEQMSFDELKRRPTITPTDTPTDTPKPSDSK